MIKYENKECTCGNKDKFRWYGGGGYKNGDYYDSYYCKICGKDIRVNHKNKEENNYIGTHDGGWNNL